MHFISSQQVQTHTIFSQCGGPGNYEIPIALKTDSHYYVRFEASDSGSDCAWAKGQMQFNADSTLIYTQDWDKINCPSEGLASVVKQFIFEYDTTNATNFCFIIKIDIGDAWSLRIIEGLSQWSIDSPLFFILLAGIGAINLLIFLFLLLDNGWWHTLRQTYPLEYFVPLITLSFTWLLYSITTTNISILPEGILFINCLYALMGFYTFYISLNLFQSYNKQKHGIQSGKQTNQPNKDNYAKSEEMPLPEKLNSMFIGIPLPPSKADLHLKDPRIMVKEMMLKEKQLKHPDHEYATLEEVIAACRRGSIFKFSFFKDFAWRCSILFGIILIFVICGNFFLPGLNLFMYDCLFVFIILLLMVWRIQNHDYILTPLGIFWDNRKSRFLWWEDVASVWDRICLTDDNSEILGFQNLGQDFQRIYDVSEKIGFRLLDWHIYLYQESLLEVIFNIKFFKSLQFRGRERYLRLAFVFHAYLSRFLHPKLIKQ